MARLLHEITENIFDTSYLTEEFEPGPKEKFPNATEDLIHSPSRGFRVSLISTTGRYIFYAVGFGRYICGHAAFGPSTGSCFSAERVFQLTVSCTVCDSL